MAKDSYDESLRRLLAHEGGYTNHPSDPGGPTHFGITIHDYRKHVKPHATAADVRAMTLAEAKAIYRERYWAALRCDELPAGIDYAVFDYGVNSGVARSGKVLRRVLGLADTSAAVTDEVLRALASRDPRTVIEAICAERLAFLKRLKTWPVFGAGWGRRVAEVQAVSLAMAASRASGEGTATPSAGKGAVAVNRKAQQASTGGVIVAGAAAAQQAHQAAVRPVIVIAIVLTTAVLAAAAWWWWRRRQKRQQER